MIRTTTALACSLLAVGAFACSEGSDDPGAASGLAEEPAVVGGGEAGTVGPSGSRLTEWVNYGDAVVVLTVVAEEEVNPPTEEELERGGGYIAREVTVEVEEVLWEYPEAPSTPDTFDFWTGGWTLQEGGEKAEATLGGPVRLEVGERYVVAVARRADGTVGPVGQEAQLHVDSDDRVDAPETDRAEPAQGVARAEIELADLTLDEVADRVASTEPHPVAEANRDLDPLERFGEVYEAEHAADG